MDLESKVSLIQSATSQQEAFDRFNQIMGEFGYTRNVYSLVNDHPSLNLKARHGFIGTYPQDWINHYHENSYYSIDPVMLWAMKYTTPFFWNDAIKDFQNSEEFSEETKIRSLNIKHLAEDAGVCDGVAIGFRSHTGEIAGVGLAKERPDDKKNYEELAEIYLLSSYLHETFRGFMEKPHVPVLTVREKEVLLWASEGKSDGDIADILGISAPTVRYHWNNMFVKLQVNNRWLAIIKAVRLEIISIHTIRSPYQSR
jgi:DNA-binding CsgD family transcriptional regulator